MNLFIVQKKNENNMTLSEFPYLPCVYVQKLNSTQLTIMVELEKIELYLCLLDLLQ